MKKTALVFLALATPIVFLSSLDGPLPQNTGAPGDLTCGRSVCHNVPVNVGNAEMDIIFNSNEMSYEIDSTYSLTVKITNPQTMRNGFQMLALDESLQNAGTWELLEPSKMEVIPGIGFPSRKYVTHLAAGNFQQEWTLAWKAPASDVGKVTFYAAVNATNNDGKITGDQVYTKSVQVDYNELSSTAEVSTNWFKIVPSIATDAFSVETQPTQYVIDVALFDSSGLMVLEKQLSNAGSHIFSVSGFTPGIYFVRLTNGDQVVVKRIVICR